MRQRIQGQKKTIDEYLKANDSLIKRDKELQSKLSKCEREITKLKEENTLLDKAFFEGYEGTYLIKLVNEYRALRDGENVRALLISRYPAPSAAEKVKAERERARQAEEARDRALLLAESCRKKGVEESNQKSDHTEEEEIERLRENNILLLAEQKELEDEVLNLREENKSLRSNNTLPNTTGTGNKTKAVQEETKKLLENTILPEQKDLESDVQQLRERIVTLRQEIERLRTAANYSDAVIRRQSKEKSLLQERVNAEEALKNELAERLKTLQQLVNTMNGASYLFKLLDEYRELRDQRSADALLNRPRPAYTAAEKVKTETAKRRAAELERDKALYLVEVYKELIPDSDEIEESMNEPEDIPLAAVGQDSVRVYLSKDEYLSLSDAERNQLALDRFWSRNKSKRLIGKLYEQYIGYLFEKEGASVEYFGISKGLHDLGRDLICKGKSGVSIVQCKNWSKSKTIYEKHIFQLFGTVYQYSREHPLENAQGVFYTSTHLSDLARDFAKEFKIEVHEDFELKPFPIIKCHVGVGKMLGTVISLMRYKKQCGNDYHGALLIIDEADVTLHQASQIVLADLLFKVASKNDIQVILTTHSVPLIEALRAHDSATRNNLHVWYLLSRKGQLNFELDPSIDFIKSDISLALPQKSSMIKINVYTEDAEAQLFLKKLLGAKANKRIQILPSKCNCQALRGAASIIELQNAIFVLDGDQAPNPRDPATIIYLPGGKSPEKLFGEYLNSLSEDDTFWTEEYSKKHFIVSFPQEGPRDREIWKNWFNAQKKYWGTREISRLFKRWSQDNIQIIDNFKKNFKTIFDIVAKRKGLPPLEL